VEDISVGGEITANCALRSASQRADCGVNHAGPAAHRRIGERILIKNSTMLGLSLAVFAFATAPSFAQGSDPAQIIRDRREGLKAMGAQMEAMGAIAQARGDTQPAIARIETIQAFFANFADRFPANTQAGETRALPAVFTDRAGFTTALNTLNTQLAALRSVAASGDAAAFGPALQATGASCGACHRAYRSR